MTYMKITTKERVSLVSRGEPPAPLLVWHHKDGNPRNNRLENLEWLTQSGGQRMTSAAFVAWLAEMKKASLGRSDAECARLLGISANSVVTMKVKGADLRTALACRALLHRLEPYE